MIAAEINPPMWLVMVLEDESIVHHHVDLAWAFTDFKVQGLTWKRGKKLILSLNKSTATKNLNIKTISVCFSRVQRLEDLRILPLDLDDPENSINYHVENLSE